MGAYSWELLYLFCENDNQFMPLNTPSAWPSTSIVSYQIYPHKAQNSWTFKLFLQGERIIVWNESQSIEFKFKIIVAIHFPFDNYNMSSKHRTCQSSETRIYSRLRRRIAGWGLPGQNFSHKWTISRTYDRSWFGRHFASWFSELDPRRAEYVDPLARDSPERVPMWRWGQSNQSVSPQKWIRAEISVHAAPGWNILVRTASKKWKCARRNLCV